MPMGNIVKAFETGVGNTLGHIALVVGLGTMLGKMMAESGGAERIARTLIRAFGEKNAHWAMMVVAFIIGLPVFFEVGFVLLIPIAFNVAKRTGTPILMVGLPMVAGLSVVHGLIPPHPAALLAVTAYQADIGKTILYALIVGLPTAILAGPLFAMLISRHVKPDPDNPLEKQFVEADSSRELPPFGITLFTILLPVVLMLIGSWADLLAAPKSLANDLLKLAGNSVMALLIAALVSFYTFGRARGFSREAILKFTNECLAPIATITLVVGAAAASARFCAIRGVQGDRGRGHGREPVAAAAGLGGGGDDPHRHRLGHGGHDHRLRHRRADRGSLRRGRAAGADGAGHRRRLADPLARQRRRLLAGQGILQPDRAADLPDVDRAGDHHLDRGAAADAGARHGDLTTFSFEERVVGIDSVVQAGPVIPVLQFQSVDEGVAVCRALYAGGIRTFEITMRTPVALDVIRAVARDLGSDAIVGAGTLTRPEHFQQARDAGAVFAVSPGITPALAQAQAKSGLEWLPGIATPSELILALEFGLGTLKFFPAEAAGGIPMLKSIHGPFGDVRFCPTGGITPKTAPDYLALPNVACVGGSWMVPKDKIADGDWAGITALAAEAAALKR